VTRVLCNRYSSRRPERQNCRVYCPQPDKMTEIFPVCGWYNNGPSARARLVLRRPRLGVVECCRNVSLSTHVHFWAYCELTVSPRQLLGIQACACPSAEFHLWWKVSCWQPSIRSSGSVPQLPRRDSQAWGSSSSCTRPHPRHRPVVLSPPSSFSCTSIH
jgi:hypothetical protein